MMHLPFVSILLRRAYKFLAANRAVRALALVDALDMNEQIGSLTIRFLAHRARMSDPLVHALDVRLKDFAIVEDLLA